MRRIALPLTLALAASCATVAELPEPEAPRRWSAALEAARPNGVTGSAQAIRTPGSTAVQIEIRGATPGGAHPWHLHSGACGSGGPVVGELGRYTALRAGTDGGAAAAAVLDLEIQRDSAYHVNVHRSASEMGTIVACGVLVEE
jgi:hypothetical protein